MDECEDAIPGSFNLIVNSEDPRLNMSRVTPSNRELLSSGWYSEIGIAEDRNNFQEAFGKNPKLSIDEDAQDSKLAKLLAPG